MDNGSKKSDGTPQDHPSLLAYVVGRDGKVFSLLSNNQQYQASSLAKWANEQLDAYEKQFPSTRMPFIPGHVEIEGEGTDETAVSKEIVDAREAKKPMLLYFGRGHFDAQNKRQKKENKAARKFEKVTLNSKAAAKDADGWVLVRFDLSNPDHAKLAKQLGVKAAPDLVLWTPDAEKPKLLGRKTTGGQISFHIKKYKKSLVAK